MAPGRHGRRAGDTFAFDAAERLFGLLPEDQRARCRALWDDFEARETPDAHFANALDRFQGLLQNVHNNGGTWKKYEISRERILERMDPIGEGAPALWPWVLRMVDGVMGWG